MRDYTRECTPTLRMQSWLVNSSETALRSSGILLFTGIISTANSGLPLWEMYFRRIKSPKTAAIDLLLLSWCHAFTDFTVAVPALTDLSSYLSEISVVILGSVDLYVKYYLCIFVRGRNPHYAGGRFSG